MYLIKYNSETPFRNSPQDNAFGWASSWHALALSFDANFSGNNLRHGNSIISGSKCKSGTFSDKMAIDANGRIGFALEDELNAVKNASKDCA